MKFIKKKSCYIKNLKNSFYLCRSFNDGFSKGLMDFYFLKNHSLSF